MSNNKMLIDATHPEETRVVVLRGGRVEEFDYESAARKLLRGNIYLAKVTRVEPSLQAAFVDYGGNRHGFLAFNEIHPDYYQIPMADRQALIEEEAQAEAEEEAAADARAEARARRNAQRQQPRSRDGDGDGDASDGEAGDAPDTDNDNGGDDDAADETAAAEVPATRAAAGVVDEILSEPVQPETVGGFDPDTNEAAAADDDDDDDVEPGDGDGDGDRETERNDGEAAPAAKATAGGEPAAEVIDEVGSEDALEETRHRPRRRMRSYKIQEVIKRRQVILVQVVKEERGNKGAALTTYLSLAGRYTVLMPNTARGGGISRKITNPQDRKRLKAIAQELEVPEGMGLIIRTAGAARTKQEIKRDFEYLLRLWESVREMTLQSVAPSLVYEEGNLIKRSIRDLYTKEIEEIVVAGDAAFAEARDFMRMLMPSHVKNVIEYREPEPLFTRYGIERQLNAMFSPFVTLRSGGYLVINQTEALVAIDINSGKSTREFSIEETALNTNLEAADEIARQLKLRDLAGLIVIDFIDMEERRNNRKVESRVKEALRFDRARIQVGRISHFGLLEMSRQRLRTGVLEGSTSQCPHCQGTGIIRSTESVALAVLRGLEDALMAGARTSLIANTTTTVALYILNKKRQFINDMEARNGISIAIQASDKLQGANFTIEKGAAPATQRRPERAAVSMDWGFEGDEGDAGADPDTPEADEDNEAPRSDDRGGERSFAPRDRERARDRDRDGDRDGDGDGNRRRRRRRRRGGRGEGRAENGEGNGQHHRHGRQDDRDDDNADAETHSGPIEIESDDTVEEIGEGAGGGDEDGGDSGTREPRSAGDNDEQRQRRGRRRGRRGGRRGRGGERGERGERHAEGRAEGDVDRDDDGDAAPDAAPPAGTGAAPVYAVDTPQPSIDFDAPPPRRTERPRSEQQRAETRSEPPAPAPVAAPAQAEEPETKPAPRRRHEATTSEPKIERVVVRADATTESNEAEATPPQPARKGWWSRKLGG